MKVPLHVFREYDIRGIVGDDLTADLAHHVGRAYGTMLLASLDDDAAVDAANPTVALGGDNRPTSVDLADALGSGLQEAGVSVVRLGTVPTPVTYWAEKHLGSDGAIQITGSHNPPEWNGIKMTMRGRPFYGDAIQGLRETIENESFATGAGSTSEVAVLDAYVRDVAGRFSLDRPVKMAVDCGNGTGAVVAERLLGALGVDVLPLYCTSDGTFPNHHPDPAVDENLNELIALVKREGADFGVAFDGDADRIGVVDDRGRIIRGDVLLLLFGLDLLKTSGPGQLLLYDVKCSQVVPEVYEAKGGRTLMWKTGHSHMKEKMAATGAPIAGELSGHICFADDFIGTDDALYAACRLAAMVARGGRSLSSIVDEIPEYVSTPELRIPVSEDRKAEVVEAAVAHFRDRYEVIDVDGARILFGDGWGLLRKSNTQPVLVARFEARTSERLAEIRGEIEGWLEGQGVDV